MPMLQKKKNKKTIGSIKIAISRREFMQANFFSLDHTLLTP